MKTVENKFSPLIFFLVCNRNCRRFFDSNKKSFPDTHFQKTFCSKAPFKFKFILISKGYIDILEKLIFQYLVFDEIERAWVIT